MTASTKTLFIRTWKKEVEPRVMIGERTSGLETTWMRNTSAIDRLGGPEVSATRQIDRPNSLEICPEEARDEDLREGEPVSFGARRASHRGKGRTSPFWLKTKKAWMQRQSS